MAVEAAVAAAVLLGLFSLRRFFGLAPVYTTVGVFYYLATLLASTTFIKITPELLVSPGSVALFPASLFAVLLVYIREDAREARNMIYGLLAANVFASLLGLIVSRHLGSELTLNPLALPAEIFVQSPRLFIVGAIALYADTILIILVYEAVSRAVRPLIVRLWLSLALVLAFDTFVFVTGGFAEHPAYEEILTSGVIGKAVAAVVYAAALALYLSRAARTTDSRPGLIDLFDVLTYRQRYEALRAQAARDPLTGLYNRGFCDDMLRAQLALARRTGAPVSVMMADIDHFKKINDTRGHAEGDKALRAIARALAASARGSDIVCRYGGEEFCLILPGTPIAAATQLAGRVREEIPAACAREKVGGWERTTVTIGIAAFPGDGEDVDTLMRVADKRMYAGKKAGRDRVVSS